MAEIIIGVDLMLYKFTSELNHWEHHFRKDDRFGSMAYNRARKGNFYVRISAINTTLLPANLDLIGIPKNGYGFEESCEGIVEILWEKGQDALQNWVKRHDQPIEYLSDGNDPRVMRISQIAQGRFGERSETLANSKPSF